MHKSAVTKDTSRSLHRALLPRLVLFLPCLADPPMVLSSTDFQQDTSMMKKNNVLSSFSSLEGFDKRMLCYGKTIVFEDVGLQKTYEFDDI